MFKSPTKFEFKKKKKKYEDYPGFLGPDIYIKIKLIHNIANLFPFIKTKKKSSCFEQKRFNYFETIVIRGARELSYSICTR